LQFLEPQAANFALVERFDNFARFRNGIRRIAEMRDEWAGIPMPIEDDPLVIEPTYPKADELMAIGAKESEPLPDTVKLRNTFWSRKHRMDIVIWEEDGKIQWGPAPVPTAFDRDIYTVGASVAWGIEQESHAVHTLAGLLRHHQFKAYLLTGMFLEKSQRSGLTYLFRKLKPTVVLDARSQDAKSTRILCALCLHPIAYYSRSGAGAMTPTDDVIAHLMLMRGDEPMFWRRSNQHAPYRPEARLH
jgi:hypothetical protein